MPSSISVGYLAVGQAQVVQIQKTLATGLRVRFVLFCMSKFWLCLACPLLFKAWYAGVQNLGNIMPHWSCKRPCLASLRTLNECRSVTEDDLENGISTNGEQFTPKIMQGYYSTITSPTEARWVSGMMHVQSGLPPQPTASIGWRALGAYSDFGRCSFAPAPQIVLAVLLVHVLVALSIFLVRSALKAPTILVSYDVKMDCKVRVDVQIQALYHHHLTWVFCWDSGSDSSESYVPVEQRALRSLHLDSIRMVTQYLL